MDVAAYQKRIKDWVIRTFGEALFTDRRERAARVVEEAIELAQAEGLNLLEVDLISMRVYSRPAGEVSQEAAGLSVCLLAYADTAGMDLDAVTLTEIERIESVPVEKFRRKQAEKAAAGTARAAE